MVTVSRTRYFTGNGGGGALTHGDQVTSANTGPFAYFAPELGRLLISSDLATVSGSVDASTIASGGLIYKKDITGALTIDTTGITVRACRVRGGITGRFGGVDRAFRAEWCWVGNDGSAWIGDEAVNHRMWDLYRCRLHGFSDGLRHSGPETSNTSQALECYVRIASQAGDHNDGCQNFAGGGDVILQRCNISIEPENGTAGGRNACVFAGDLETTGINLLHEQVIDCLLDGFDNQTLLLPWPDYTPTNIHYTVTGNKMVNDTLIINRGTAPFTAPTSAFVWSGNTYVSSGLTVPLT